MRFGQQEEYTMEELFAEARALRKDGDKIINDVAALKETTQVLAGERNEKSKKLAAVRRNDLYPLAALTVKSKRAAAAPTQAEYNALQEDVERMIRMIELVMRGIGMKT